jgi:hypothetical protein
MATLGLMNAIVIVPLLHVNVLYDVSGDQWNDGIFSQGFLWLIKI